VPAKLTFKPTDTDLGATIAAALEAKPEALVVWAYPAQATRSRLPRGRPAFTESFTSMPPPAGNFSCRRGSAQL